MTYLRHEWFVVVVGRADGVGRPECQQEADVMLAQVLPLTPYFRSQVQIDHDVSAHTSRVILADLRLGNLEK